jgi:hypothetical protein
MKALILAFGLFFFSKVTTYGQQSTSYPYWSISKDVQKMQFKNKRYTTADITTSTSFPSSKGVAMIVTRNERRTAGRVKMEGMPSNVISKGVARMQYENK